MSKKVRNDTRAGAGGLEHYFRPENCRDGKFGRVPSWVYLIPPHDNLAYRETLVIFIFNNALNTNSLIFQIYYKVFLYISTVYKENNCILMETFTSILVPTSNKYFFSNIFWKQAYSNLISLITRFLTLVYFAILIPLGPDIHMTHYFCIWYQFRGKFAYAKNSAKSLAPQSQKWFIKLFSLLGWSSFTVFSYFLYEYIREVEAIFVKYLKTSFRAQMSYVD